MLSASIPDCNVGDIVAPMSQRESKVSISIRLDSGVHKQLAEYVSATGGSLNGEIQRRLSDSLRADAADVTPQLTRIEHTVNAIAATLLSGKK